MSDKDAYQQLLHSLDMVKTQNSVSCKYYFFTILYISEVLYDFMLSIDYVSRKLYRINLYQPYWSYFRLLQLLIYYYYYNRSGTNSGMKLCSLQVSLLLSVYQVLPYIDSFYFCVLPTNLNGPIQLKCYRYLITPLFFFFVSQLFILLK